MAWGYAISLVCICPIRSPILCYLCPRSPKTVGVDILFHIPLNACASNGLGGKRRELIHSWTLPKKSQRERCVSVYTQSPRLTRCEMQSNLGAPANLWKIQNKPPENKMLSYRKSSLKPKVIWTMREVTSSSDE